MAALSYAHASLTGVDPAFTAADASGDVIPAHPNGFLHVKNADTAAVTVTVVTPGKSRFGVAEEPDLTVSVPAGSERLIGPLGRGLVDQELGGASVTYSSVTSVTRAAIRG